MTKKKVQKAVKATKQTPAQKKAGAKKVAEAKKSLMDAIESFNKNRKVRKFRDGSDRAKVLKHLQTVGSINADECAKRFGTHRLSAVIYDLDKAGYKFKKPNGKIQIGRKTYDVYRLAK